ncbi:OsmC family protein [Cyanobium sp. ATX 6A2]|uniref:OsmC family protein n=1 Tax=Cyanobium sp. ATX 6A2 TaxID=2823700 RepID=UPI0020CC6142|nr:OsmC family protein [Cyanobium sp. ATX 6A2]MCP9887705.1 OsmC family protein [Cyanobium sp. ATX 6A2]
MTTILCRYDGGMRCIAEHGPSGSVLTTDPPTDNAGRGECFSPTDLVATALATCLLTVMGIVAERHGWPLDGAAARVTKTMSSEPPRRIAALEVWVSLPRGLDVNQRHALQRAAEGCPVKASLEEAIHMTLHWELI